MNIPNDAIGKWQVETYEVTAEDARWDLLRATFSFSSGGRSTPQGTYTRLMCGGVTVMSDTPDEINDHRYAIQCAKGNVLVNGLGLGVFAQAVLEKPEVEHVTIIEISPEVIYLVGRYFEMRYSERVTIIEADALTWQPPPNTKYDLVWHDIWDNICADNLPEMKTLTKRYGSRTQWQASWCRGHCEWLRGDV